MPLTSVPSFRTLDQAYFIATGEHLSPIAGDQAPRPVEYYIKCTLARQQRARLWELLDMELKTGGVSEVRHGNINGTAFTHARRHNDQIDIYNGPEKMVMSLTPDGVEPEMVMPASPPTPFVLRTPWLNDNTHPAFELSNDTLLKEHAAAKEEVAHAHEHLTAIQTAMRVRHVGRS